MPSHRVQATDKVSLRRRRLTCIRGASVRFPEGLFVLGRYSLLRRESQGFIILTRSEAERFDYQLVVRTLRQP